MIHWKMSQSRLYKIPYGSLFNKVHGRHNKPPLNDSMVSVSKLYFTTDRKIYKSSTEENVTELLILG